MILYIKISKKKLLVLILAQNIEKITFLRLSAKFRNESVFNAREICVFEKEICIGFWQNSKYRNLEF